jgi:glucokinase-like ROK family protein
MKHVASKSERDKHVIQAAVWRFGPLSRVEIHKLTHLRPNTISTLVRELLNEGCLVEAGPSDNPMGRKQILLRLNQENRFLAAVELDDEMVIASTLDLSPRIISSVRESTNLNAGVDGLVGQLLSTTRQVVEQAGVPHGALMGIGIADPGLVNTRDGVVLTSSTIDFWKQVPLRDIFEREFGVPVLLEDKTRARATAERMLGAGQGAKDMIFVDYGRGIGAGIIVEGKPLRGHRWAAGEFGHTHVSEDNTACPCGSFGCLEAMAGGLALELRIRKAISEGSSPQYLETPAESAGGISAWQVLRAASQGDKTCSAIVEQAGNYLGLGLANLVNLFNPSIIVLDRRLEQAGQALLDQIVRIVKRQALSHCTDDLEISFAKLDQHAGVLGVALMLLERHFEIPALKPPAFMLEPMAKPVRRSVAA